MKKIILGILLIFALALGVFGCGDSKAAKVKELNDYLKQEEAIANKFEQDFNVLEKNSESAQSLDDFTKFFAQGKELTNKCANDLKALKTPTDLKAYKDKEVEILNQVADAFGAAGEAFKKDPAQIEAEAKKVEDTFNRLGDTKETDAILQTVAKDAGIKVEITNDSILFKE